MWWLGRREALQKLSKLELKVLSLKNSGAGDAWVDICVTRYR